MTDINSLNISNSAKQELLKIDRLGNNDGKINGSEVDKLGQYLADSSSYETNQGITKEDKNVLKELFQTLTNALKNKDTDEINNDNTTNATTEDKTNIKNGETVSKNFTKFYSKLEKLAKSPLNSDIRELLSNGLLDRLKPLQQKFVSDNKIKQYYDDSMATKKQEIQEKSSSTQSSNSDYEKQNKKEQGGDALVDLHDSVEEMLNTLYPLIYNESTLGYLGAGYEDAYEALQELLDGIESSDSWKNRHQYQKNENYYNKSEINDKSIPDESPDDSENSSIKEGEKVRDPETGQIVIKGKDGHTYDISGRRIK